MKRYLAMALAAVAVLAAGYATSIAAGGGNPGGPPEFVTICHAAGQAGTTHFVTLTIPYNAAFGQAGHFGENGTPNAGHEQDYLGPCSGDETTPTETETTPTTPTPTPTPTTTTPPPPRCPPGEFPTDGKDGEPGNEECEPPPPPPTTPGTTTPTSTVPTLTTTTPTPTTTTSTVTNPPAANSPQPKTPTQTTSTSATKPAPKPKAPKLTGNPKKDKCVDLGNGTMNCKGVVVVPGQG